MRRRGRLLGGRRAGAERELRQRGGRAVAPAFLRSTGVAVLLCLALVAVGPAGAQLPTLPGTTTTRPPPSTTSTQPWPVDPGTTTTQPPPPPPPPATPPEQQPPADPGPAPDGEPPAGGPAEAPAPVVPGDPAQPAQPGEAPPPGAPAPGGGPGAGAPGSPGAAPGADGAEPPAAPREVPADARRAMASVRRSGPNGTRRLLDALEPLRRLGFGEEEVVAAGFGRFPVGGHATFTHDWYFPRFTPTFHLHVGTDIFARTGTPVRAPTDGMLRLAQGGSGGLAAYVYQPDGTYYYMAHLSAFVDGQRPGQRVRTGEVVGFVGDSGNARGGSPHVHFEYHPAPTRAVVSGRGKARTVTHVVRPVPVGTVLPPADPKAVLDQWLADALAAVPRVVEAAEASRRADPAAAPGTSSPAALPDPAASRAQLMWASSVSPSGGAVRLAEAAALDAASAYDWSEASRRQEERMVEQVEALARASAILGPLTPPALRRGVAAADA